MVHLHPRHRAVVHLHPGHRAVIHAAHAHVGHRAQRPRVHRRDRRGHARPRGEGAAGIAAAVLGLGEDRVGAVSFGPHDHVVGLGDADAELVDRHRLDIVAVGLDHGHRQVGDAHVEDAHRRAVDEAQPHPLAGAEQRRPVGGGRAAVDQVGVGRARDIEDVGRAHPHVAPHQAVGHRRGEPILAGVGDKGSERALPVIVVVALEFEVADDGVRVLVAPIRQHHHIIAVERLGVAAPRLDDDRAVEPGLLLKRRMAVVPVGAALPHRKAVDGRFRPGRCRGRSGPARRPSNWAG